MPRPLTLLRFHIYSLWNWRSYYIIKFVEPITFYLFLVTGVAGIQPLPLAEYVFFATAGMMAFLAFRCGISAVTDVANDRKWGVFAIYLMQKGSKAGYVVSIIIYYTLMYTVQALSIWILSALIFPQVLSIPAFLGLYGSGYLVLLGWVGIAVAGGGRINSYPVRDSITSLTSLPMVLSAPLFYSLDSAHPAVVRISQVNPLTYLVELIRQQTVSSVLWLALWSVAGIGLGLVLLTKASHITHER